MTLGKYTTEVRSICEAKASAILVNRTPPETLGDRQPEEIVSIARDEIISPSIIIGDVDYSQRIKDMILLHYYFREICDETFGAWKLRLNNRLREKAMYYTWLYESLAKQTSIGLDPFRDVDFTRERNTQASEVGQEKHGLVHDETASFDTTDSRNEQSQTTYGRKISTKGTGYQLHSDTPEGSIAGINAEITGMEGSGFLSDAEKQTTDTTETHGGSDSATFSHGEVSQKNEAKRYTSDRESSNAAEQSQKTIETLKGKRSFRTLAAILTEYRESLLNLDALVISDMHDLFLTIW